MKYVVKRLRFALTHLNVAAVAENRVSEEQWKKVPRSDEIKVILFGSDSGARVRKSKRW